MKRICQIERTGRRADALALHLPYAAVTGILLLASALYNLLPVRPLVCASRHITGIPCLFCGSTRSFAAMSAGEWSWAFYNSPMAALLYLVVAAIFIWNVAGPLLGAQIRPGPWLKAQFAHPRRLILLFALLVVANWFYRLSRGLV